MQYHGLLYGLRASCATCAAGRVHRILASAALGLMLSHTGRAAGDILTYSNSAAQQGAYPWWGIGTLEISDDVHRISDAAITGVDIGYLTNGGDPLTFRLRFYEFEGPFETFPPPLLAEYFFDGLPADVGNQYVHLALPEPLSAPADLWVGFHFSDSANGLAYWPPTVGSTNDYWLRDYDLDGVAETLENDQGLDALYLNIYSVPEPTAGALVLGALLFVLRAEVRARRN